MEFQDSGRQDEIDRTGGYRCAFLIGRHKVEDGFALHRWFRHISACRRIEPTDADNRTTVRVVDHDGLEEHLRGGPIFIRNGQGEFVLADCSVTMAAGDRT